MKLSRTLLAVLAVFGMLGLSVTSGAGTAEARKYDLPRERFYGNDTWGFGNHASCRGPVYVSVQGDTKKPGWIYVTYRPGKFVGDGPGWKRNPRCRITMVTEWNLGFAAKRTTVTGTPRGGKAVTKAMFLGSGPHMVWVGPVGPHKGIAFATVLR